MESKEKVILNEYLLEIILISNNYFNVDLSNLVNKP